MLAVTLRRTVTLLGRAISTLRRSTLGRAVSALRSRCALRTWRRSVYNRCALLGRSLILIGRILRVSRWLLLLRRKRAGSVGKLVVCP